MDISAIICTYNRSSSLQETLKSLEEMIIPDHLSWELIIVDNNSSDDTREVVRQYQHHCNLPIIYTFERMQGKSYALNAGIRKSKGNILAFTDDDVTVDPHWLWQVKKTFDRYDCMAVGGKIIPVWPCEKPSWLSDHRHNRLMSVIVQFDLGDEPGQITTSPFGANVAFKKIAFQKYGLFSEDLGPNAENLMRGEDTEFCSRLIRKSENFIYAPKAIVYHPVEKKRIEKTYWLSWYLDYGKASIRMNRISENAVCYFGVPRYLIRILFENFLKWNITFNSQRRFYYKLQFYQFIGKITECYKISK